MQKDVTEKDPCDLVSIQVLDQWEMRESFTCWHFTNKSQYAGTLTTGLHGLLFIQCFDLCCTLPSYPLGGGQHGTPWASAWKLGIWTNWDFSQYSRKSRTGTEGHSYPNAVVGYILTLQTNLFKEYWKIVILKLSRVCKLKYIWVWICWCLANLFWAVFNNMFYITNLIVETL